MGSRNCTEEYCECVFRLQVALNDTVELVIIDEGVTFNANHPMHLHGHQFYVVGMDRVGPSEL
jgi:FtsP/CotA-like multicopper oxidase with cupredoxin domain